MASKDLTIRLLGDLSDLQKKLNQASNDLSKVGATMTKKVTPAAAGTAIALTKMGNDWNAASDAIIVGTGASGKALDGLLGSAKKVAGQVPNDFGDVGSAIAEVNTRLGLTGPQLEDATKRFLDLSRITGTDVKTNIASVTRVFGDWSVASDDQAAALDMLFEATKRTGIGLDRLTTLTVQYGAPLRQLGFSMEEATALFASFEREGVNVETVMAGLRMGLGKMAKAGEEPIETFQRLITEIKEAGSTGEANKLALEGFGQRAGPDMAAAIREGRFEIGELVEQLNSSGGALDDASSRTIHLDDRLRMLKNRVTATLGPFGEFGGAIAGGVAAMGPLLFGLGQMGPALVKATQKMGGLRGSLTKLGGALGVAGVALAAYAVHQQRVAERAQQASEAMSELSRVADEDIGRTLSDAMFKAAFATGSWEEAAAQVARTNLEGAKRARDWAATQEDGAEITEYLTKAIEDEEAAREQQTKTLEEHSDATDEATEATEDHGRAVADMSADVQRAAHEQHQAAIAAGVKAAADEAAEQAADRHRNAVRRLREGVESLKREIDDEQAWLNLQNSMDDTIAKLEEGEGSARDQRLAILDLKEEVLEYAESINLPAVVTTKLDVMLDQGKVNEVKWLLAQWGNGITLPIKPYVINTGTGTSIHIDSNGNVKHGSGKAGGGPTEPGTIFPVGEGGKPELYSEGGHHFLIPGDKKGQVTPAKQANTAGPAGGPIDLSDDTIMKLAAAMGRAAAMRDASLAGALTQGRRP